MVPNFGSAVTLWLSHPNSCIYNISTYYNINTSFFCFKSGIRPHTTFLILFPIKKCILNNSAKMLYSSVTGRTEEKGCHQERLWFSSRPGPNVPANWRIWVQTKQSSCEYNSNNNKIVCWHQNNINKMRSMCGLPAKSKSLLHNSK